ncbi:hypothetical protein EYZ11_002116 [Aspergillus tanneri]|uniref:deuterolysin n=1 Tax=Aspergillus tanneri TaxID=1220188 RepID=A0A4S3JTH0_9EURO|nr:uncharacterized protein ATNIH1004_002853 [Aspergillus tanneri]KAA8650172.1 hypothetical protein ATNIH1004_002853 [Aspergillus tanneri]THC98397.1 hypothetical protein EYZ11_002116 [Aspergillus tanneri]
MLQLSPVFLLALTAAWGSVSAHPQAASTRPNADKGVVNVELVSLGNTTVMAKVTNTANQDLKIVKPGSILDSRPTRKVKVYRGGTAMNFIGVDVSYVTSHLTPISFLPLFADETIKTVFDVADLYDLSSGGQFTVVADSALEYTVSNTSKAYSWASFKSNVLDINIPKSLTKSLKKRAKLEQCQGDQTETMKAAMARAAKIARAGADSAKKPSELFKTFFMTDDKAALDKVSSRLEAIAKEAEAGDSGTFTQYCTEAPSDGSNLDCSGGLSAVTTYSFADSNETPTNVQVYSCSGYWNTPKVSTTCWNLDQAGITVHEYAHGMGANPDRQAGETETYGYDAMTKLSTDQALRNADSYAYFAQGAFLKCDTNGKSNNPDAGKEEGPSGGDGPSGGSSSPSGSSGQSGGDGPSDGSSSPSGSSGPFNGDGPSGGSSSPSGSSGPFNGDGPSGGFSTPSGPSGQTGQFNGGSHFSGSSSPFGSSGQNDYPTSQFGGSPSGGDMGSGQTSSPQNMAPFAGNSQTDTGNGAGDGSEKGTSWSSGPDNSYGGNNFGYPAGGSTDGPSTYGPDGMNMGDQSQGGPQSGHQGNGDSHMGGSYSPVEVYSASAPSSGNTLV